MNKTILIILLNCLALNAFARVERDILQKEASDVKLEKVLIDDFSNIGFPDYNQRTFWETLPEAMRQEYIRNAEEYLNYDWPLVKATDYLEFVRSGNRKQEVFAAPHNALTSLVMGELMEGKGRFFDDMINGVWYYSEQTWWGWSAHLYLQEAGPGLPDGDDKTIDLGVGQVANTLSWTWYLFKDEFDKVTPLIATRLKNEIMDKVVVPYYERIDFWWQGLNGGRDVNNWNPWTNHNVLTAILIMEEDRDKKAVGVEKVVRSLDQFLNIYPDDGGCDEGPSYWGRAGASLYQNLDLLKRATGGQFDVYDNQLIKNMGSYIYKAYIEYPYFINFADADATTGSRPQIIYSYGKDIDDPVMWKFGAFLAKKQNWGVETPGGKVDEQIMQLMLLNEIEKSESENALISDFWLPDTEVAGARDAAGSSEGFFFAAKGGHNAESHNHNDIGSCVLYFDGKPAIIDIGRETYTAKTFSSQRYEIWTMQSQYHNLPRINGVDQKEGRTFVARNSSFIAGKSRALFSTDIADAYPPEAKVKSWIRTYRLDRGKRFLIDDEYVLDEVMGNPTSLNFVTACKVSDEKAGVLKLEGDGFVLEMNYDVKMVRALVEFFELTDDKLKGYWPKGITRVVFEMKDPGLKGKNTIEIKAIQ